MSDIEILTVTVYSDMQVYQDHPSVQVWIAHCQEHDIMCQCDCLSRVENSMALTIIHNHPKCDPENSYCELISKSSNKDCIFYTYKYGKYATPMYRLEG